jgi:hypothetical protein
MEEIDRDEMDEIDGIDGAPPDNAQPDSTDQQERRRQEDRRRDHETAAQVSEAAALKRAFGGDAAERFLKLRGINDELAREALLENYDRRQASRRARPSASAG